MFLPCSCPLSYCSFVLVMSNDTNTNKENEVFLKIKTD